MEQQAVGAICSDTPRLGTQPPAKVPPVLAGWDANLPLVSCCEKRGSVGWEGIREKPDTALGRCVDGVAWTGIVLSSALGADGKRGACKYLAALSTLPSQFRFVFVSNPVGFGKEVGNRIGREVVRGRTRGSGEEWHSLRSHCLLGAVARLGGAFR